MTEPAMTSIDPIPVEAPSERAGGPRVPRLDADDGPLADPIAVNRKLADADKPKSLLAQLREWLATVPDDHPYGDLAALAREAGWDWLVREMSVTPGSQYEYIERTETGDRLRTGSTILVSFDVLIGRAGMDAVLFETADRATIALPGVPGPVSVAARAQISTTIVYMLFGRLPPTTTARPEPANKVVVDMEDDDVELPGDEPVDDEIEPMVTGADVEPWTPGAGLPDVVVSREDGVPVFADLDDIKAPSGDIIVAVTNEVNAALVKMTTVDQVMDFWAQNENTVFNFLRDFATLEQRSAIKGAFNRRKGQIEAGFTDVAPRRRGVN